MKIYLDFDGTVLEHAYPKMGRCNFGGIEVIKKLQGAGHEIILNTYRADLNDGTLEQALRLLNEKYWMLLKDRKDSEDFEMKPITNWCKNKINPHPWSLLKAIELNEMYIDDIAYGMPLKKAVMTTGDMVDWNEVEKQLMEHGIIK